MEEENYMFPLHKFKEPLKKWIESNGKILDSAFSYTYLWCSVQLMNIWDYILIWDYVLIFLIFFQLRLAYKDLSYTVI